MLNVTPCIDAILLFLSSQLGLAGGREGDGVTYPGTAGSSSLKARNDYDEETAFESYMNPEPGFQSGPGDSANAD